MKSAYMILKEQIQNFYLIRRLSMYELKSANKSNYLGASWEVLNPLIQILIYWFVFGSIMKRADIQISDQNFPFITWLVCGFILWTFFYQSVIQGSKSIYTRLAMLSKMNFPMSVIPSIVIFSQLYIHVFLLLFVIILLNFMGFYVSIYYIQIIYFLFATIFLVFAISLITSTLSTIIRDVHMLLNAVLRMFLYVSPVLWPISSIIDNKTVIFIVKLNPLYYLIEGYRASLLSKEWYFFINWEYTLYFWGITIILFLLGAGLHMKFRRHFIDYL